MKQLAFLLTLFFGWVPTELIAQAIVVRSGEHENFTRLVMQLPSGVTWQIDTSGNRSTLVLENHDQGFDLSNAFAIIPRLRLQALVARQSELELQMGCSCSVEGFTEQNGYLVIDVSGPPEESVSEPPTTTAEIPPSPFSFGDLLWQSEETSPQLAPTDVPDPDNTNTTEEVRMEPANQELARETQRRLVQAYARAISIGLVDPVVETLPVAPREPQKEPAAEIFDSSETEITVVNSLGDNIRVTTSKDVLNTSSPDHIGLLGGTCPDPARIDIANWATDETFSVQIGRTNQHLHDDIGRLQEDEILRRTRLYLHFGFGAEAYQTLFTIPQLATRYPELIDLSQVMEHGFMPNPRQLHLYADCNSDYALWGILSAEQLPDEQAVDINAALRGLEKLPGHLKTFLGQELSARLAQRGDLENAMIAKRSFERVPETNGQTPRLVDAQIADLQNEPEAAREILAEIVAIDASESPEAVMQLVENHIQSGKPVPADVALLAETYVIELRNTPYETPMYRAHVMASAASGQFSKAFDMLIDPPLNITKVLRAELANFLASELANAAEDIDFLERFYASIPRIEESLNAPARIALARRLVELGFYESALDLSANPVDLTDSKDARLLAAELYLYQARYAEGLAMIGQNDSPEALALRARAEKGLGQLSASAESFQNANQSDKAITISWLSEGWSDVIDSDDPVFGPARRVKDADAQIVEVNDSMLSNSAEAIEASGWAREQLNELLENVQVNE